MIKVDVNYTINNDDLMINIADSIKNNLENEKNEKSSIKKEKKNFFSSAVLDPFKMRSPLTVIPIRQQRSSKRNILVKSPSELNESFFNFGCVFDEDN